MENSEKQLIDVNEIKSIQETVVDNQVENRVENKVENQVVSEVERENKKPSKKPIFSARKIASIAIFAALAYLISFLEFAIFPSANFLKLDFSNVLIMLGGFAFGPISGVAICVIKELLCFLTKSSTGGVGEIANFLMTTSFIIVPSIVYYFKKGLKVVIPCLLIGCVLQTVTALITNRFINFPLYMGSSAEAVFNSLWQFIVYFNLIKTVAVSTLTVLIYKRISKILHKIV